MHFQHSSEIWSEFPELSAGVLFVDGISKDVSVADRLTPFHRTADARLAASSEGEFPEIRAWRRAFSTMGLKPTQYRCASESLLRRFRKEGSLPEIHPLIDLCNAVSLAYAIPVAVFDASRIGGGLEVRHAVGDESYLTFSGQTETPEVGEVVFADDARNAHARRWTNRQSAHSAARDATSTVLIVAEGLHDSAIADVQNLTFTIADELDTTWTVKSQQAQLSRSAPRFEF
ncbi:MAG: B3/B4 domain-containing protein [Pseudonocardiaceae bacterium]